MAFLEVKNVKIVGVSACVPKQSEAVSDIYHWDGLERFIEATGIKHRRRAAQNLCSSDLCCASAENLLNNLGWDRKDVDVIVFVSQSPDYISPCTSVIIQKSLGLSNNCYALDISLGCSGWVYALSVISSLMQNGALKRGLLLAGDTITRYCSPDDKSTWPLFGDAGTATAIEFDEDSQGFSFLLNCDGDGADAIMIKDGGCRNPVSPFSFVPQERAEGCVRSDLQLDLKGMDVFSFGISKAPKSVNQLLEKLDVERDSIDLFTFHQANLALNEMIRKKLKLSPDKVPYCLEEFANTSCASIPLTLVSCRGNELKERRLIHIACGFGVGLSWGSVYFKTDRIVVPELLEICGCPEI